MHGSGSERRSTAKAEGLTRTQAGGGVRSTKPLLKTQQLYECRRPDRISVTPSGFKFVVDKPCRGFVLRTPPPACILYAPSGLKCWQTYRMFGQFRYHPHKKILMPGRASGFMMSVASQRTRILNVRAVPSGRTSRRRYRPGCVGAFVPRAVPSMVK